MGNLAQSNTIAQSAAEVGISPLITGLLLAAVLGFVLSGKQGRTVNAAAVLMPVLCGFYLLGCAILIAMHIHAVPMVFAQIFREAFGIRAAGWGISAGVFLQSMKTGIRRGIFSNEAGLGSSGILHMHTADSDGARQGRWAAAEVFGDTVVCCTATALVLLTAPETDLTGKSSAAQVLLNAFASGLGRGAGLFVAVSMILFAFATMIGWFPCGLAAAEYLFGKGCRPVYAAFYVLLGFAGAFGSPALIWAFSDCCNGLMALPNLWAVCRLLPETAKEPVPYSAD
jgi:AGCS family alanine or glycine:cation symporter